MDAADCSTDSTKKTCTKCGESKPRTEFYRATAARDGLFAYCRDCTRVANAAYKTANAERLRVTRQSYTAANAEKIRIARASYRAANAERERAYNAAYRAANPDKRRAMVAAWRAANPERIADTNRAWRLANPDRVRAKKAVRRARQRNAPVIERIYRAVVWERDAGKCHICGRKADPNDWHLDHIVPLALGGEHSYRNVAVSHPECNQRKNATGPGQMRLLP